jgi:hypothetical protein
MKRTGCATMMAACGLEPCPWVARERSLAASRARRTPPTSLQGPLDLSGCQFESSACAGAAGAVFAIFMSYPAPSGAAAGAYVMSLARPLGVIGTTQAELLVPGDDKRVRCHWEPRQGGGMDITLPPPPVGTGHA